MVLEIAQLGANILKQTASRVDNVDASNIRQLVEDMLSTLATTQGVGLAAPQVGAAKQIIIVASRPSPRYPKAPLMEPTVMINPSYVKMSEVMEKDWEGCLSIPAIRALVPRYRNISIKYTNVLGTQVAMELDGFIARVFQHEYDHLLGNVYLDRVETDKDVFSESEYLKIFDSKVCI